MKSDRVLSIPANKLLDSTPRVEGSVTRLSGEVLVDPASPGVEPSDQSVRTATRLVDGGKTGVGGLPTMVTQRASTNGFAALTEGVVRVTALTVALVGFAALLPVGPQVQQAQAQFVTSWVLQIEQKAKPVDVDALFQQCTTAGPQCDRALHTLMKYADTLEKNQQNESAKAQAREILAAFKKKVSALAQSLFSSGSPHHDGQALAADVKPATTLQPNPAELRRRIFTAVRDQLILKGPAFKDALLRYERGHVILHAAKKAQLLADTALEALRELTIAKTVVGVTSSTATEAVLEKYTTSNGITVDEVRDVRDGPSEAFAKALQHNQETAAKAERVVGELNRALAILGHELPSEAEALQPADTDLRQSTLAAVAKTLKGTSWFQGLAAPIEKVTAAIEGLDANATQKHIEALKVKLLGVIDQFENDDRELKVTIESSLADELTRLSAGAARGIDTELPVS
jgi:hypothetical protein